MKAEERFRQVVERLERQASAGGLSASRYRYPEVGTAPELEDNTPEEQRGILEGFVEQIVGSARPAEALALDAGCGVGRLTPILRRAFSHVVSLDADGGRLAVAERRDERTSRHRYLNLPIDHPVLLDRACGGAFAAVFCVQVFGHIPHEKPAQILGSFRHLLCDGGYLVLSVPFTYEVGPSYQKVTEAKDFETLPITAQEYEELARAPLREVLPVRRFDLNDLWGLLKEARLLPRAFRDHQWEETGGDLLVLAQKGPGELG